MLFSFHVTVQRKMWARTSASERHLPGQPGADERRLQPGPQASLEAAVHWHAQGLRPQRVQRRPPKEGSRKHRN